MAQRVTVDAFVGPSNTLASKNVAPCASFNFMCQNAPPGFPKVKLWERTTPGLRPWTILTDSPIRAEFQQDGRGFVVAGRTFFEVFANGTSTSYGSVASDAYLASICSNGSAGNQLLIVSGGLGYVFSLTANTLTQIADGDFPANVRQCLFIDGYGVVFVADSRRFQISALEDFTDWDALDFGERSIASDNIVSMVLLNRNIWFLGSKTSEPWYDSGDPLFPFQPVSNTLIPHGSGAAFGACVLNDAITLLGQDETGTAVVWRFEGYSPTRISTHAVELSIANAGAAPNNDFALTTAWTYQEQGQSFYILQCPEADTTWCFDTTTNLWHERLRCNPDFETTVRTPGQCHMYFAGKHLVGDRSSGAIYEQSLSLFTEELLT